MGRVSLTSEEFINKAYQVHGDRYNYSKVNYINTVTKIEIICSTHGSFFQRPRDHLQGNGCPKCKILKLKNNKTYTKEEIINKANKVHNFKYDYSKVNYIDMITPVVIVCPLHGEFKQCFNNHINNKHQCPKCSQLSRAKNQIKSVKIFINEANLIHNFKYDYSKVIYKKAKQKVVIICPLHGEFKQSPALHLQGQGCPYCNESKGEKEISKYLESRDINYIKQKTFDNCKYKRKLKFDFYLPDYNACIEYNGKQHYKEISYYGGMDNFNIQVKRDNIKKDFCSLNKINLLEIRYDEDIEGTLNSWLKTIL